ncbi:MAG: MarR family winged helix-turn-helix transcriptional regulator [Prevotella sp.]|uniref:MarR family winged helix-turn-helix transcriptional regulator n=1 Tax=Dysgonomonas sp. TaxID=1891233 RepID=UPI002832C880|nr:MarR family winged helix-turn-helix transcriptional regulator [Dysgonomonas sp.]MDR1715782.1 MarR family winged helix-turn-helix transcriptional regulator [Prevotella sp.]HMM03849.1 MarR family winged helix-turn-helix transcriptional regulator [Dysgonomonas sp.]
MERNRAITSMENINIDTLISHVLKLWSRSKKQILDEFGLTGSQFEILAALYDLSASGRDIIQVNLSEETGIDPMTTSSILRNLEKGCIITRVRGRIDTRVIYIGLTDHGKNLYKTASVKMANCCDNLYRNIDKENLTIQLLSLSRELNKFNN